jgi:hypothetical protein
MQKCQGPRGRLSTLYKEIDFIIAAIARIIYKEIMLSFIDLSEFTITIFAVPLLI